MVTDVITPETQEEVHQAVVAQPLQNAPAVPFKTEIVEFSIPELAIQLMEEEFLTLTIAGPDDRKGFEYLHKCRMITKDQRIFVDKGRVRMKAPALEYGRKVDETAKSIASRLEKIEEYLELQEKAYIKERERIADEKALAIRVRTDQRTQLLRTSGFNYNAINDAWEFGEVAINFDDIKGLGDEDYQPTADLVKATYDAEQQRIADERIKGERAEQRIAKLRALGFFWNADNEVYQFTDGLGQDQLYLTTDYIKDLSDEDYESYQTAAQQVYDFEQARLQAIAEEQAATALANQQEAARLQAIADQQAADQKAIDDAREQLEKDKKKLIFDNRSPKLIEAGFDWNGFRFKLLNVFRLSEADIIDMTEIEFTTLLTDAKKKVKEAADEADRVIKEQKKAAAAKRAADKAHQARLKPDKKVIKTHLLTIFEKPAPAVTEPESTAFLKQLYDGWDAFVKQQIELLEAL